MNKIFFIACLCCFYLIGASCSTICKKKSCCPQEGHGKCPFCHIEDYETDLKNALK